MKVYKTLNKLIPITPCIFRDMCNVAEKKGMMLAELFLELFLKLMFSKEIFTIG